MRIRLDNGEEDEIFPYDSMQVAWMKVPKVPVAFSSHSVVPRPFLPQAVGYGVEVQSREEEADEEPAFCDRVVQSAHANDS